MCSPTDDCFGGSRGWSSDNPEVRVSVIDPCDMHSHLAFRFCQGSTQLGLKFETFYGDAWEENVENKFRQWAVRVFGGMFG